MCDTTYTYKRVYDTGTEANNKKDKVINFRYIN